MVSFCQLCNGKKIFEEEKKEEEEAKKREEEEKKKGKHKAKAKDDEKTPPKKKISSRRKRGKHARLEYGGLYNSVFDHFTKVRREKKEIYDKWMDIFFDHFFEKQNVHSPTSIKKKKRKRKETSPKTKSLPFSREEI